jgi:glucose/arabinose dehydrogenase
VGRRLGLGALVAVALVVACTLLLPERFAVNAPLLREYMGAEVPPEDEFRGRVRVPEGFEIRAYADGIRNARFLRFTDAGDLLVSSPRLGTVFLVEADRDGDGRADAVRPLLEGLDRPHGLETREGWLYVAEGSAVRRVRLDAAGRRVEGALETVVRGLPSGGNHWTRTVRFGPDGWMYVSIGSSCNVCLEEDPRRAAVVRYRPDGSGEEIYAQGLRNAVGLDFHPATGELWVTDNGRDLLGDDFPPCELNRVVRGGFYGWPFVNGASVPDPDFGTTADERIARSLPPAHGFGAHTAPLGIAFYRGTAFPERYRGAAFVALHGSWNRTRKSGYKVVALEWDAGGSIRESDFAVGFELEEDVIGRPVDVVGGPDGALYVSDDFAGAIYRIRWSGG